jgi:hypothetical protein
LPDGKGSWEPSARVADLLFVDFDGVPASPDDVISDGLDGGYRERTEGLREVLRDADEEPAGRFLACVALTRWGDPAGYETVVQAARSPESVPWRGASYDRLHGEDDTFGVLADAVGDSADMVEERGTAAQRAQAAGALLSAADRIQYDRHISSLLRQDLVSVCLPAIKAAVDSGITMPAEAQPSFDLGLQLALLISAAHRHDATWAVAAARRLTAAQPGERALKELHEVLPGR